MEEEHGYWEYDELTDQLQSMKKYQKFGSDNYWFVALQPSQIMFSADHRLDAAILSFEIDTSQRALVKFLETLDVRFAEWNEIAKRSKQVEGNRFAKATIKGSICAGSYFVNPLIPIEVFLPEENGEKNEAVSEHDHPVIFEAKGCIDDRFSGSVVTLDEYFDVSRKPNSGVVLGMVCFRTKEKREGNIGLLILNMASKEWKKFWKESELMDPEVERKKKERELRIRNLWARRREQKKKENSHEVKKQE